MLVQLELKLVVPAGQKVSYNFGSLLHGALMELLSAERAELLHTSGLRPFSQYLLPGKEGEVIWRINGLEKQMCGVLLEKLLSPELNQIDLKHKNISLFIQEKKILARSDYLEITRRYYVQEQARNRIIFNFLTPTTFKSEGRYQLLPRIDHIYQNLLQRWNAFSDSISLADEEILREMVRHTELYAYKLQSCTYHLEGVKIPSFRGWVELAIRGPEPLKRIITLLSAFAEFAGIGIKTSLGMGGVANRR